MRANTAHDVWRHVDIKGKNECWLWNGGTFNRRYGRFSLGGKSYGPPVIVFIVVHGSVPEGQFVLHKCNNKLCCNPEHLVAGTNSENQRHAVTSGAFAVGATGIRGVSIDKKRGYWTAQGYLNGKKFNLYTGPSMDKAVSARRSWENTNGIRFDLGENDNENL